MTALAKITTEKSLNVAHYSIENIVAIFLVFLILICLYYILDLSKKIINFIRLKKRGIRSIGEVVGKHIEEKKWHERGEVEADRNKYYISVKFKDSKGKYHAKQIQCSKEEYWGYLISVDLPYTIVNVIYDCENPDIFELEDDVCNEVETIKNIIGLLALFFALGLACYKLATIILGMSFNL